jgi:hypothetical protein
MYSIKALAIVVLFFLKINIISVRTNISTIPFNFSNIKVAVEVSLFLQGKIKIMVNNQMNS